MPDHPSRPQSTADSALVKEILKSPEQGWKSFLEAHENYLRRLLWKYDISTEDREEIFQEVCFRLLKEDARLLRNWDQSRSSLRGYLAVVTASVAMNFLNSRFHRDTRKGISTEELGQASRNLLSLLEDSAPTPLERMIRAQRVREFERLLGQWVDDPATPEVDRLILRLRLGGATYAEIAKYTGLTEKNVSVRLTRIRDRLRKTAAVRDTR